MLTIKSRGGGDKGGRPAKHTNDANGRRLPARPAPAELLDQLDWIESTAAMHRAALAQLSVARSAEERRVAAREETLALEMHRTAVRQLRALWPEP